MSDMPKPPADDILLAIVGDALDRLYRTPGAMTMDPMKDAEFLLPVLLADDRTLDWMANLFSSGYPRTGATPREAAELLFARYRRR